MSPSSGVFEPYADAEAVWDYLADRFGLERSLFAGYRLWHRQGGKPVWIAPEPGDDLSAIRLEWLGLPVLRRPLPRGFPTNAFLRRFGGAATRNVVDVDWDTALRLMYSHQPEWSAPDPKGGPYIIRTEASVLGRGWVRKGRLVLETPKGWADQLLPRTELAEVETG